MYVLQKREEKNGFASNENELIKIAEIKMKQITMQNILKITNLIKQEKNENSSFIIHISLALFSLIYEVKCCVEKHKHQKKKQFIY